jgi:hypothetical protein
MVAFILYTLGSFGLQNHVPLRSTSKETFELLTKNLTLYALFLELILFFLVGFLLAATIWHVSNALVHHRRYLLYLERKDGRSGPLNETHLHFGPYVVVLLKFIENGMLIMSKQNAAWLVHQQRMGISRLISSASIMIITTVP